MILTKNKLFKIREEQQQTGQMTEEEVE